MSGELKPVLDVLLRGGFAVDVDAALESARARGDFKLWWRGMRVDVFVASIPLYDAVRQRVRQAPLGGRPAWLVAFMGPSFDRAYVRNWLTALVGPDDERVARWERILSDVGE